MTTSPAGILTIGHSTHSADAFVALLARHHVTAVADVRSVPFSRHTPHFNREPLAKLLKRHGITYVFLGRELGARSDDPTCYVNGRVQYSRIARTKPFSLGLARLIRGAESHRVAIMCAEKEPLACHRTLLVARELHARGIRVDHILDDGTLESHDGAMLRLLDVVGLPHEDLFQSREELIAMALARQEERIAYVDESLRAPSTGGKE